MNSIKPKTNITVALVAAVTVILLLAISGIAQTKTPPAPPGGVSASDRLRDPTGADMRTRSAEIDMEKGAAADREKRMAQITDDFQHLQALNSELMSFAASDQTLDYTRLTATTEEIHKRAVRLNSNLSLPKAKDKHQKSQLEPDKGQMKESLQALNDMIGSFVTNPIFKKDAGVDPQLTAKAKHDLEGIIELSGKIKKSADKLNNTAGKSR